MAASVALICVTVPVSVTVFVPLPEIAADPPATVSVPLVTARVTVIEPMLPSAASDIARPVMALPVSSLVVCATTVFTGVSLTGVMLSVMLSVSVSPLLLVVMVITTVPLALPAVV